MLSKTESSGQQRPSAHEREELTTLVQGIVRLQGNAFIRSLLRKLNIKLGVTKAEFEKSLLEAIESGQLQRHHVGQWLEEVEGWGNQHVYLYKVPPALAQQTLWSDPKKVERKAIQGGIGKAWDAQTALEFPAKRALTRISFSGDALSLTWHQGVSSWIRVEEKDEQR